MARHNKDHIELFHDYGLYVPTRTIVLKSDCAEDGDDNGVNYFMTTLFTKNLYILENLNKDPITIILNTTGGNIYHGMAIYDLIRAAASHITIKVIRQASSIGSVILQAGDERVLTPHSHIMFHLGSPGAAGNNIHEVINAAKHELEYGNKIDKILYERIKEKHDRDNRAFTKQRFQDMNFKGRYLHAQEAIDLGLADRIE